MARARISSLLVAVSLAIAGHALVASPARGALLLVDGSGKLIGAQNVTVGSTPYDVFFVDGPCATFFSGCNESADFAFSNVSSAFAAAQALLSQVFIDGSGLGLFDSNPGLTTGCSGTGSCIAAIPYGFDVTGNVVFAGASNSAIEAWDGTISLSGAAGADAHINQTYAVFSVVPLPAALLHFGSALAALIGIAQYRRRRRQKA